MPEILEFVAFGNSGKKFPAIFPGTFPQFSSRTPAQTPETATAFSSFLKGSKLISEGLRLSQGTPQSPSKPRVNQAILSQGPRRTHKAKTSHKQHQSIFSTTWGHYPVKKRVEKQIVPEVRQTLCHTSSFAALFSCQIAFTLFCWCDAPSACKLIGDKRYCSCKIPSEGRELSPRFESLAFCWRSYLPPNHRLVLRDLAARSLRSLCCDSDRAIGVQVFAIRSAIGVATLLS